MKGPAHVLVREEADGQIAKGVSAVGKFGTHRATEVRVRIEKAGHKNRYGNGSSHIWGRRCDMRGASGSAPNTENSPGQQQGGN